MDRSHSADVIQNLDDRDEPGRLGDERKERRHRRSRPLVHIARIGVQRNGSDLEGESCQQHHHGQDLPFMARAIEMNHPGDFRELGLSGGSVKIAESEEHDGSRHRAQEEVFHPSFLCHRKRPGN